MKLPIEMNNHKILVRKDKDDKGQEVYAFYLLKTASWAEDRGLNSWISGHEVKEFVLLAGKRYKVSPNCDIFLLVLLDCSPCCNGDLELAFEKKLSEKGIRQKNYKFTKHPHLENWWAGEIKDEDLNLLVDNDFCHTVSLSHRRGDDFKKVYSFYLENHV